MVLTDFDGLKRCIKIAKELGVHVEITTLLINKENTEETIVKNISKRILEDLGKDTPFHITRAYPHYKSISHGFNTPTPISFLEKAYKIICILFSGSILDTVSAYGSVMSLKHVFMSVWPGKTTE